MGYYNVVRPSVVAGKHYIRPTVEPIELADDAAAESVAVGDLAPYLAPAGGVHDVPGTTGDALDGVEVAVVETPKPRGRSRKAAED